MARFKEVVNIQPQTVSTGQAQVFQSLGERLDNFSTQQANRVAEKQIATATIQGQQAGIEQQQAGGPLELKEETFIGGISKKAFNTAAREGYLKSLDNDNIESINSIAAEFSTNLPAFNDAVNAYSKGVMSSVDPLSKGAVGLSIDSMVVRHRGKIQAAQAKEVVDQGNSDQAINSDKRSRLAQTSAFEGDTEQAGINLALAIDSVSNRTDISDEKKATLIRNIQLEEREAALSGELSREFNDNGPGAALDKLDKMTAPGGFTPDEFNKFVREEQTKINRKVQRQKQDLVAETKQAKIEAKTARGMLFLDPAIPANTAKGKDTDREDVNLAYDSISENMSPDEKIDFVVNTGLVPDSEIANVNAFMRGGNAEQVAEAADYISRIQEQSPASLKDIPDESRAMSLMVSDAVRAGTDIEVALEQARKATFGITDSERDVIRVKTQEVSKKLTGNLQSFVNSDIDEGGFDPSGLAGVFYLVPEVSPMMDADFRNSFSRFMSMTGGDEDQAQKLAYQSIKNVWSVTEIGGPKRFMKYSPEVMYDIPGIGSNWIEDQFNEEMEGVGVEGAILSTDHAVARSAQPSYPVLVPNEFGGFEPLLDDNNEILTYKPDFRETEQFKDLFGGGLIQSAKEKRARIIERRSNVIRRGITSRVLSMNFIPANERLEFIDSEEGKKQIDIAINNMRATDRLDDVEAQEARNAFGI